MKKIIIFVLILFPMSTFAFNKTFVWDPNTEEKLSGYSILWGTTPGEYPYSVNTKMDLAGIPPECSPYDPKTSACSKHTLKFFKLDKTYYLVLVAYDEEGNVSETSDNIVTIKVDCKNGHGDFCRDCGVCGPGQGDCDGDKECAEGLVCSKDVGEKYGFHPDVDVCEEPKKPIISAPKNFRILAD